MYLKNYENCLTVEEKFKFSKSLSSPLFNKVSSYSKKFNFFF